MHYARKRGYGEIRGALEHLQKKHGGRFQPAPGWVENR